MSSKRKQLGKEIGQVVFPLAENVADMPNGYISFLDELKGFIKKRSWLRFLMPIKE